MRTGKGRPFYNLLSTRPHYPSYHQEFSSRRKESFEINWTILSRRLWKKRRTLFYCTWISTFAGGVREPLVSIINTWVFITKVQQRSVTIFWPQLQQISQQLQRNRHRHQLQPWPNIKSARRGRKFPNRHVPSLKPPRRIQQWSELRPCH